MLHGVVHKRWQVNFQKKNYFHLQHSSWKGKQTLLLLRQEKKILEMKVNADRLIIWLGEFFAGRNGRVLRLGCYNYAEVTYEATDHRLQKVIPECPQQPQPPSAAWEESISLTSLTQTQTKIKCSILGCIYFSDFPRSGKRINMCGCLRNHKGDDSTQ